MNSFLQFPVNLLKQICLIVFLALRNDPPPFSRLVPGTKKAPPSQFISAPLHPLPAPPCRTPLYCSDHMCAPQCTCGLALKRGLSVCSHPPKAAAQPANGSSQWMWETPTSFYSHISWTSDSTNRCKETFENEIEHKRNEQIC